MINILSIIIKYLKMSTSNLRIIIYDTNDNAINYHGIITSPNDNLINYHHVITSPKSAPLQCQPNIDNNVIPFCFVYKVPCINFENECIVCFRVIIKYKDTQQYNKITKNLLNYMVIDCINDNNNDVWNIEDEMVIERPALTTDKYYMLDLSDISIES